MQLLLAEMGEKLARRGTSEAQGGTHSFKIAASHAGIAAGSSVVSRVLDLELGQPGIVHVGVNRA